MGNERRVDIIPSTRIGLALELGLLLLLAACGQSGGQRQASPSSLHVTAVGPHTVEIQMSDDLRFVPDRIIVDVGQTVKFFAHNRSSAEHEFFIGDAAAQEQHEREMRAGTIPNMHYRPDDMVVMARDSNELSYTFTAPGELIFGCHEPGHYAAGMRGTIEVVSA